MPNSSLVPAPLPLTRAPCDCDAGDSRVSRHLQGAQHHIQDIRPQVPYLAHTALSLSSAKTIVTQWRVQRDVEMAGIQRREAKKHLIH